MVRALWPVVCALVELTTDNDTKQANSSPEWRHIRAVLRARTTDHSARITDPRTRYRLPDRPAANMSPSAFCRAYQTFRGFSGRSGSGMISQR